jgi:mono/diheme cytochrome c family protein
MRRGMRTGIATAAVLLYLFVAGGRVSQGQAQSARPAPGPAPSGVEGRALIDQYCLGCHSDRAKAGGLALSALNLDAAHQSAEVAEKVIRKLRGGLMPPAGARRPDSQSVAKFVSWLENEIDTKAAAPHPGRVALRRLNRREYANAVRDLLGLNIDATAWLPDDNVKGNFDTNAAALQVSPNFVDQYIYAARAVALEAIGNR